MCRKWTRSLFMLHWQTLALRNLADFVYCCFKSNSKQNRPGYTKPVFATSRQSSSQPVHNYKTKPCPPKLTLTHTHTHKHTYEHKRKHTSEPFIASSCAESAFKAACNSPCSARFLSLQANQTGQHRLNYRTLPQLLAHLLAIERLNTGSNIG